MLNSDKLGQLDAEVTMIKPSKVCPDQFNKTAPAWNDDLVDLEIGHRGAGASFLEEPNINSDFVENTILSINTVLSWTHWQTQNFDISQSFVLKSIKQNVHLCH